ncbi:hypothetical protein ACOTCR_22205 [Achromobacter xylosoxidans]
MLHRSGRNGLTADTPAAQLVQRPECAVCLCRADNDVGQQRAGESSEREAWAADMLVAGATHLGGDYWEGDADDFAFRLWTVATRRHRRAAFDRHVFAFLQGEGVQHGVDFGECAPGAVGK